MQSLTLRQLRIFVAVADQGSLAGAGRALRLSQATVSEALRDLEVVLDQTLFHRSERRLRLAAAGQALLADARRLLRDAEAAYLRHAGRRRLTLAASVTVGNYILPPLIVALARQDSDLEISVVVRNSEAVVRLLLDRAVEAAVVEGRVAHPDLLVQPWRRDALVFIVRPDHPFAAGADGEALAHAPWVLREHGSGTRESFESAATAWPAEPRAALTVGGNELLKAAVMDGLGVGCLSRAAVAGEISRGELAEVKTDGPALSRTLSLVRRANDRMERPMARFLALCEAAADVGLDPGAPARG